MWGTSDDRVSEIRSEQSESDVEFEIGFMELEVSCEVKTKAEEAGLYALMIHTLHHCPACRLTRCE